MVTAGRAPVWLRRHGSAVYLTLVMLGLSGGSYYLGIHNAVTVAELCQAGNEFRGQQAGLWAYLIHLSPPPKTAQGRMLLARFEHHLRVELAPRNCQEPLTVRSTHAP